MKISIKYISFFAHKINYFVFLLPLFLKPGNTENYIADFSKKKVPPFEVCGRNYNMMQFKELRIEKLKIQNNSLVFYYGVLQYSLVFSSILWCSPVFSGILWFLETPKFNSELENIKTIGLGLAVNCDQLMMEVQFL